MAPNAGWNTYRLYKEGTTKLTTWLVDNALRCKADVQTSASRNTNNGEASSKSKYTVPLTQFVRMAKTIAHSTDPRIRISQNILALIKYTISMRKHAATFFSKMAFNAGNDELLKSNASHQYFIEILEQVLNILDPSNQKDKDISDEVDLPNTFSALTVEEPTSEGTAPPELPEQRANVDVSYEPEADDFDNAFAVFSFFEDLNSIREFISGVWVDYANGQLDLMSAAVTTDTGFRMIKDSCEALIDSPAFIEIRDSDVWDRLPWNGNRDYMIAVAFLAEHFGGESEALREWTCGNANNMLSSFAQILTSRKVPVLKPDHYGVYKPEQDRSAMSLEEQDQEDLIITMNLLQEFTKLSRAHVDLPVEDELTRGIRLMTDTCDARQLPMFAGFAFQILLDIHNSLRNHVLQAHCDLQNHARRIVGIMDDYLRLSKNRRIDTWAPTNDEVLRMIKETANFWVLDDIMTNLPLPVPEGAPKMPSFYLLKNHPVLAGLLLFHLNLRVQDAGISLCNAWGSVLYPAHLYNACQQSAGLTAPWRDIEYMIETHSAKRLFVGAPPSEPSDYLKRFVLALGGSAATFARNRRPGGGRSLIVHSKKGPRGLKTTTPVRDTFEPRYVDHDQAVVSKANLVAMLSVAMKARRTNSPSVDLSVLHAQITTQRDLTPTQVLQVVREGMAGEEHHLIFDYILLRMLHTHLTGQLSRYFGPNFIENESELPFIIGYVFEVMAGSDRIAQALQLELGGSNMLHTAAETMKAFLEDGTNARQGLINTKVWTRAYHFHHRQGTVDQLMASIADEW
ncbi:unnamed protein product [Cercospora beticola]|nr:unnamed protein product [Cercospora beticola]